MTNTPKLLLIAAIVGTCIIGTALYVKHAATLKARQSMIHNAGANVMPFDLNQTMHVFKKTDDGGIQQVIVKDPSNNEQQIGLIQMHLQMEAGLFQQGNFQDPAKLHGQTMPGLDDLKNGVADVRITYSSLINGGQITYSTSNQKLIQAIHKWFDAQLSDHGNDAKSM